MNPISPAEDPERFAETELEINESLRLRVTAMWNTRGGGGKTLTIQPGDSPALAKFLLQAALENGDVDIPGELVDDLTALGVLVPGSEQPQDELAYNCVLDLAVRDLVPYMNRLNYDRRVPEHELVVNAGLWLQRASEVPEPVAVLDGRDGIAAGAATKTLWVRDAGTGIVTPYSFPPRYAPVFDCMENGEEDVASRIRQALATDCVPVEVDRFIELLRRAHILVDANDAARQEVARQAEVASSRAEIKARGFVVLRQLLNPVQLGLLRAHYRIAEAQGVFQRDGQQVEKRLVKHNELFVRFLQPQIARFLSTFLPHPIKSSYTMSAIYESGAELKRHTDRAQCAWNLSFAIDAAPETDASDAWPFYVETSGETHEVRLELGDAVLYSGTNSPHWRDRQPEGSRSAFCFFHFVDEGFEGALG